MKIYQVSLRANDNQANRQEHCGYQYFDSKKHADQFVRDQAETYECEINTITVPATREGLLRALNNHGDHPDNG